MIKRMLATLVLIAVTTAPSLAMQKVSMDGTWWNNLSRYEQLVAVQSLMDGVEAGKGEDGKPVAYSQTFGFYIASITNFYAKYPDASNATVGEVMLAFEDSPRFTSADVARFARH